MTKHMLSLKNKVSKNFFIVIVTDICLFVGAYFLSFLLRFDFNISHTEFIYFYTTLLPVITIKCSVFYFSDLYQGMWRYTSINDLKSIIKASFVSSSLTIIYVLTIYRFVGFSRSVFFIDGFLTVFFTSGFRLLIRLFHDYKKRGLLPWININQEAINKKKIVIIGAGDAGEKILREINDNQNLNYEVVCFLDDDENKHNKFIHGIKVLGNVDVIVSFAKKLPFDEIVIAIPSLSGKEMRRIIELCNKSGIKYKTIPGIGELIDEKVTVSKIREVSYEDLLGRNQVELEIDKIGEYLRGKCVLVTGAGGSIGSELCRQVARFEPEMLVMFDRAESDLYNTEQEVKHFFPKLNNVPILGSATCLERVRRLFDQIGPDVVFHAAAYKHVPLMEMHPWEAVYNNIQGTKYLLETSIEYNAEKFIFVSTDKAVRPTNIMGATKRVAELILQLSHQRYSIGSFDFKGGGNFTKLMAVRFGNVVGSAGSVIPLFKKQISIGGPVTITHPEVIRYFMTISEAVQLILQAGAIGEKGQIYILKMGRPVKIIDMAKDLIQLSGLIPDKDIKIEITGLRPGEKLYEELISEGEGIVPTRHDKILVLKQNKDHNILTKSILNKQIEELIKLADLHDITGIKWKLKEIVPEYTPEFKNRDIPFYYSKSEAKITSVL